MSEKPAIQAACEERDALVEALRMTVGALFMVVHDRPSAHSDAVWSAANEAHDKARTLLDSFKGSTPGGDA